MQYLPIFRKVKRVRNLEKHTLVWRGMRLQADLEKRLRDYSSVEWIDNTKQSQNVLSNNEIGDDGRRQVMIKGRRSLWNNAGVFIGTPVVNVEDYEEASAEKHPDDKWRSIIISTKYEIKWLGYRNYWATKSMTVQTVLFKSCCLWCEKTQTTEKNSCNSGGIVVSKAGITGWFLSWQLGLSSSQWSDFENVLHLWD